jgi:CRP-like cAMP-binding protein
MPRPVDSAQFAAHFPAIAAGLSQAQLKALLDGVTKLVVSPGTQLIRYHGRSGQLYLVWSGRLRASLESGAHTLVLGDIGPGRWVGEVTVLDHGPATATVTATEVSTLLVLARDDFERLRAQHPELAARLVQALARNLAQRLRHTHAGLLAATSPSGWLDSVARQLVGAEAGAP